MSSTQASVLEHHRSEISRYGHAPSAGDSAGALCELLRTSDLYQQSPCAVAPYAPGKLNMLSKFFQPRDVLDIAPPSVCRAFSDPDRYIRLSEREAQHVADDTRPLRPYWDQTLVRDRAARVHLVRELARRGLVSFRLRIRSRVGLFFVHKKHDQIRLIVDAREASRFHRAPPHVALGSAAALSGLDLSDCSLQAAGFDFTASAPTLYGASVDLQDSFYQFRHEPLGEYVGIDFYVTAATYEATEIWTP